MQVDLHTHSCYSDGQYSPTELVHRAASAQITHLALTDHDAVLGLAEAMEAAKEQGIAFLTGIEISTAGYRRQHILGYGIDPQNAALLEMCEVFSRRRLQRAERIAALLCAQGLEITLEEVCAEATGQVGRPHFAKVLIAKGAAASVQDAFDRYLSTPELRALPDLKPTAEAAIALIHQAGGIAVLAHPMTLSLDETAFRKHLDMLCACGLNGVEAYYLRHTPQQRQFYAACADERGLCVTAGSDFHGEAVKPDIAMGVAVEESLIAKPQLRFR